MAEFASGMADSYCFSALIDLGNQCSHSVLQSKYLILYRTGEFFCFYYFGVEVICFKLGFYKWQGLITKE